MSCEGENIEVMTEREVFNHFVYHFELTDSVSPSGTKLGKRTRMAHLARARELAVVYQGISHRSLLSALIMDSMIPYLDRMRNSI